MKKRLLYRFLAICITLSLLPSTALAYIGPIRTTAEESEAVKAEQRETIFYYQILTLSNDYVTFAVPSGRDNTGNPLPDQAFAYMGLPTTIQPTRMLEQNGWDIGTLMSIASDIHTYLFHKSGLSTDANEGWAPVTEAAALTITSVNGRISTTEDGAPSIVLDLTFSESRITATVTYTLQRVNNGAHQGSHDGQTYEKSEDEPDQNWGVFSTTEFQLHDGNRNDYVFPYEQTIYYPEFMGHWDSPSGMPSLKMSAAKDKWRDSQFAGTDHSVMVLPTEMGLTPTSWGVSSSEGWDNIWQTEIYTDGYVSANPFFALSKDFYGYEEGHDYDSDDRSDSGVVGYGEYTHFPDEVQLKSGLLTTYGKGDPLMAEVPTSSVDGFWGYRDLYTSDDADAPTDPDAVEIDKDAGVVGIFPTNGGYQAIGAADDAELERLRQAYGYGEAVTVLRGKSERQIGGSYRFTDGAATLSPTVTATWNKDSGGLTVSAAGQIEQNGVHLNAPTFKFYQPKAGAETSLTIKTTAEGLEFGMDPENNSAVVYIDIPYTKAKIEQGSADAKGNLTFSGDMSCTTLFNGAEFELNELGYGLVSKQFKVNGVHATASINTAKLIGLELAEIEGEINTFSGKEEYEFSVELNAFDLFETKAKLNLKRCKSTGVLMPDDLYFALKTGVGTPIVPPIPVGQLTGGGLGFNDLADTVNGNYFAIPPLKLRGTVFGTYLHLIEGEGNVILGPSQIEVEGSGLKLVGTPPGMQILDSAAMGLLFNGTERTYQGIVYKGLELRGYQRLAASLPSQKLDFIKLNSSIDLGGFGGLGKDKNENTMFYLLVNGNAKASGVLQCPSEWPVVGGWAIAGADVDLTAGVQTAVQITGTNFNGAIQSAWDNADLYLGACATVTVAGSQGRVWVILPDVVDPQKGENWGYEHAFLSKLDAWNWDNVLNGRSTQMASLLSAPTGAETYSLRSTAADNQTITVSNVGDEDSAYLTLAFDASVTEEQLKGALTVTDPKGNPFTLVWPETDEDGNLSNAATANIFTDTAIEKSTDTEQRVVLIYLGKGPDTEGGYTVSAQEASPAPASLMLPELTSEPLPEEPTVEPTEEPTVEPTVEPTEAPTVTPTEDPIVEPTKEPIEEPTEEPIEEPTEAPSGETTEEPTEDPTGATGTFALRGSQVQYDTTETTGLPFTASVETVQPLDRLDVRIGGSTVTGAVEYPVTGKTYVLRTYLANTEGGADYLVDEQTLTDPTNIQVSVPASGTLAPTGEYYVSTFLMEKKTGNFNEDSTEDTALVTIDSAAFDTTRSYTNNKQPAPVTGVTLDANGNETMVASWKAPSSSPSAVSGYKITIYNADGSDTGVGYAYDAAQFDTMPGLSRDTATGAYSIDMALTAGEDGLSANKSYKVGVTAYHTETVDMGDDGMKDLHYYGAEVQNSDPVQLPAYTPLDMTVTVNGTDLTADDDTQIYTAAVQSDENYLSVSSSTESAVFTVKRLDTNAELTKPDPDSPYTLPNVEGSLMFEITGTVDHGGYSDVTTRCVLIQQDAVPPLLSLSQPAFLADPDSGKYTITGTTEPGARISDGDAMQTSAGADGSFALTGKLDEDSTSTMLSLSASDMAGNQSNSVLALVSVKAPEYVITFHPNGGTVRPTSAETVDLTLSTLPTPTRSGYTFDGWFTAAEGGTEVTTKTVFTKASTLYAHWTPGGGSGGGGGTTYAVTAENMANGTITVSPKNASKGGIVTLTVKPDSGYTLGALSVTDQNGNSIPLTEKGNGQYTFTMPSSKVSIRATFAESKTEHPFVDVADDAYYADAVAWAVKQGITAGTSATTFSPGATCTRGQMAAFLWRAAGSPAAKSDSMPFTDVPKTAYYYDAVLWAVEQGITSGATATTFGPDATCTRGQMATFLYRFKGTPAVNGENSFGDVRESDYYYDAVLWAAEQGITVGTGDGRFSPDATCNRGQMVTFLWRCMGK